MLLMLQDELDKGFIIIYLEAMEARVRFVTCQPTTGCGGANIADTITRNGSSIQVNYPVANYLGTSSCTWLLVCHLPAITR